MQHWSGYAKTAAACVVVWAVGLLWMWLDFTYGSHVWKIGPLEFLLPISMMLSVPIFIFCLIAMLRSRLRGS